MSKRIATDAKIVLERVGFTVEYGKSFLDILKPIQARLFIEAGAIDNKEIIKLLKSMGKNEYGY